VDWVLLSVTGAKASHRYAVKRAVSEDDLFIVRCPEGSVDRANHVKDNLARKAWRTSKRIHKISLGIFQPVQPFPMLCSMRLPLFEQACKQRPGAAARLRAFQRPGGLQRGSVPCARSGGNVSTCRGRTAVSLSNLHRETGNECHGLH